MRETIERLQVSRQRCDEITIERLRDACVVTWQAQVAFEIARLSSELREITGEENNVVADAAACFGIEAPEEVEPESEMKMKKFAMFNSV